MRSFFLEALDSIKTSGTIRPSSNHLIRDCLKGINFSRDLVIVEFGTGDGCITEQLVNKATLNSKVLTFEINEVFYKFSKNRLRNRNVEILQQSAFNFEKELKTREIRQIDIFVSSLPLTLFEDKISSHFFEKIKSYMTTESIFIQYQYSLGKYRELKKVFSTVELDFTIRNIPPAFIYRCRTDLSQYND